VGRRSALVKHRNESFRKTSSVCIRPEKKETHIEKLLKLRADDISKHPPRKRVQKMMNINIDTSDVDSSKINTAERE